MYIDKAEGEIWNAVSFSKVKYYLEENILPYLFYILIKCK